MPGIGNKCLPMQKKIKLVYKLEDNGSLNGLHDIPHYRAPL